MRFVNIYVEKDAPEILYKLLQERPRDSWISHVGMPTFDEHKLFIARIPFRHWYLIEVDTGEKFEFIGSIEATHRNELGIHILKKFQRKGYGKKAIAQFIKEFPPQHPIPAVRNGKWTANIGVKNKSSKQFFSECGFKPLQESWIYE